MCLTPCVSDENGALPGNGYRAATFATNDGLFASILHEASPSETAALLMSAIGATTRRVTAALSRRDWGAVERR